MDANKMTLTGAAMDVLWCLFAHGPTWDGNVPSKSGRDQLVDLGLAERHDGWQWLTRNGHVAAIDAGYGDHKDRWQRKRAATSRKQMDALRPFAEAAAHLHPAQPDDGLTLDGIEVRHWRAAAAALAEG